MQPVVVGARHGVGEARVLVGKGEDAQAAGRKQHGGVDAFGVHRFQLHLTGPAALGVTAIDLLVLIKVAAAVRRATGAPGVFGHVRKDRAEIADVVRGPSARRLIAKLGIDVALPEIGRLHDMHVAVENFESVFRHESPPLICRA